MITALRPSLLDPRVVSLLAYVPVGYLHGSALLTLQRLCGGASIGDGTLHDGESAAVACWKMPAKSCC